MFRCAGLEVAPSIGHVPLVKLMNKTSTMEEPSICIILEVYAGAGQSGNSTVSFKSPGVKGELTMQRSNTI